MNVLAHRIAGAPARRVHAVRVPAVRLPLSRISPLRIPRPVYVLTASLGATTVAMVVLQRVSERIG